MKCDPFLPELLVTRTNQRLMPRCCWSCYKFSHSDPHQLMSREGEVFLLHQSQPTTRPQLPESCELDCICNLFFYVWHWVVNYHSVYRNIMAFTFKRLVALGEAWRMSQPRVMANTPTRGYQLLNPSRAPVRKCSAWQQPKSGQTFQHEKSITRA